ncbi:hypothetical protein QBZ16_001007 [Prototheca wickerhamii]|uniref:Uncharacterized protein n=1 Tax=Prototheca wickerhamii TaxID=3111 RepID=A0AAD9IFA7_PROWI|nr:hypothetical protein QBZ16_001007 [Prototheca wickerhamii]
MAETETPVPVAETPAEEPKPTSEAVTKIDEAAPADPPQPMEEDAPAAPAPAEVAAKPALAQPAAEEPAPAPEEPKQLPVRQYLESTVVPLLTAGMQQLVKERPEDPVAFLVDYLTTNNPAKKA